MTTNPKWIRHASTADVVLATIASGLLAEIDAGRDPHHNLNYLREALDEFFAAHPHLTPRHVGAEVVA